VPHKPLFIENLQNCRKFDNPSLEFLRWRWRPDGCELALFNPPFLKAMSGKTMAFIVDCQVFALHPVQGTYVNSHVNRHQI
jgi:hypothetical protein